VVAKEPKIVLRALSH